MLGKTVFFALCPGLENTSGVSAIKAFIEVIIITGESIIDVGDLVKSVVHAKFSLENGKGITIWWAIFLFAWITAITYIIATFLRFVVTTEVITNIDVDTVWSHAAFAFLLFFMTMFNLFFLAFLVLGEFAFVFADTCAFLDTFHVLGNTFVFALTMSIFALTTMLA